MEKKRIILMILFTLFTIVLGYIIYRVFFAPEKVPETLVIQREFLEADGFPEITDAEIQRLFGVDPTELPDIQDLDLEDTDDVPIEAEKTFGATRVVEAPVVSPNIDKSGRAQFYNQRDGKFYKLDSEGLPQPMSDQVFFDVEQVVWSPTTEESIIEYPDGSNIYYDFETKKQASLPKHWESFSFSPSGEQIAAKSMNLSPDNRWLITSDPEGNNVTLVEPMGANAHKVTVDWSPNKQVIALSRTGEALGGDQQEVLMVGRYGENFQSIVVEGRDLRSQWSPSGEKLLHSVYGRRSEFKPELWVVNASGDAIGTGRKLLNLNTWADKCTFADDRFVYCGVPNYLDTGAGFAPEIADTIPDKIYRVDTQTGAKTQVPLGSTHTIDRIFTSENGQTLYFTDKLEAGLFQVAI